MDIANKLIFLGALLLVVSILASVVSARLGTPLLLVFLVLGMLAGEEGPGQIKFNDIQTSYLIGSLALAIILLDGGMRTRTETFRVGLVPAVSLATIGVLITSTLVGLFAAWILDLHWLQGLLVGAVVGSTDAAAVFSLLHSRGMNIKQRVGATLEIESGTNDPMAVFLTIALVEVLAAGGTGLSWGMIGAFAAEMGLGAAAGIAGGRLLVILVNHLSLATGLYPLLVTAGGVFIYGLSTFAGGSGFLAIYLVGLVLGNSTLHAAQSIFRFHDGLAWLSQIGMFLILGLLVTPSALLPFAPQAMLIALVLMFAARPLAVWLSLLPFRFSWREQAFIGWVGLRGAVPIILALFPLLGGVPGAYIYFNVAFFVVLVSLVLQGWTVAPAARLFGLEVPPKPDPVLRVDVGVPGTPDRDMLVYRIAPGCPALRQPLAHIALPERTRIASVTRGTALLQPDELENLAPGDHVYVLAPPAEADRVTRLFTVPEAPEYLAERRFFGDFVLNGDARVGDLAGFYGLSVAPHDANKALADFLTDAYHKKPVVGDRLRLAGVEFVVREIEHGRITKVGLKLGR